MYIFPVLFLLSLSIIISLTALLPHSLHTEGSSQNPTFDWLGAFDYYACREAHNLPLIPGVRALVLYGWVVRVTDLHLQQRKKPY